MIEIKNTTTCMNPIQDTHLVGVKFNNERRGGYQSNKEYHFLSNIDLKKGDQVLVFCATGYQVCTVLSPVVEIESRTHENIVNRAYMEEMRSYEWILARIDDVYYKMVRRELKAQLTAKLEDQAYTADLGSAMDARVNEEHELAAFRRVAKTNPAMRDLLAQYDRLQKECKYL